MNLADKIISPWYQIPRQKKQRYKIAVKTEQNTRGLAPANIVRLPWFKKPRIHDKNTPLKILGAR
jgi:hypothetical protein